MKLLHSSSFAWAIIAGALLLSVLIVGGFFLESSSANETSLQWISSVGKGLIGPACGSSSVSGSCSGGLANETISWSLDGCSAPVTVSISGGSAIGGQNCSGSHQFTGLTPSTNYSYSVTYSHWDGQLTENYSFTTPNCAPSASLSPSPGALTQGNSSTLTWGSVSATTCAGTNFSTGGATSGSASVSPLSTTNYSVQCSGAGGSSSADATVTVSPAPSCVSLSSVCPSTGLTNKTINEGDGVDLSWACSYSSSSSGVNFSTGGATSGQVTLTPEDTTSYTAVCSNGGQGSVDVTVLHPDLSISASPELVQEDETSTITWSASAVNSCAVTGPNFSAAGLSGSQVTAPVTGESTYSLVCFTDAGPVNETVRVRIVPQFDEF